MSSELYAEIEKLLTNDIVDRHSFFQLKYFIVGKEPTSQSKMWRCLSELKSRKTDLNGINLEIEETKDVLELLDIEEGRLKNWKKNDDEFSDKEAEIKKRQIARKRISIQKSLSDLERKLKFTEEEASFFLQAFHSISKKEPLKPYDDLESQKEYWNEKLSQEFNLKILLQHAPDTELVKTILALNDDSEIKKQTVHILNTTQKKLIQKNDDEMKMMMNRDKEIGPENTQEQ